MAEIPETSSFRSRICESSRSRLSVDSVGGHVPECTDVDPVIAQLVTQQSGLASLNHRDSGEIHDRRRDGRQLGVPMAIVCCCDLIRRRRDAERCGHL